MCRHIVRAPDPSGSSSAELSPFIDWPFFHETHVSVEIVLGVNTAMKEFEREQELAALYFKPKDDRVDDVEKAFLNFFPGLLLCNNAAFCNHLPSLLCCISPPYQHQGSCVHGTNLFSKGFCECSYFQMCTPGYELERLKHPNIS